MGEFFSEWIVKRKTPQNVKIIQTLLVIVCVLSCGLLPIPYVGILAVALIIFLSYLYFKNNDVEWEYALVEKTMYIDKIMKKSKRKRMGEYDLTKTEVMAPEGSSYIKEYDYRNLKCTDFSKSYGCSRTALEFQAVVQRTFTFSRLDSHCHKTCCDHSN